jgi:ArsR family transcriptional regulator
MEDRELLRVLKALADPKRFRMVQEIASAGEITCGQLGERFALSQPTMSHHLKILTDAGVLNVREEAKHHFISVNRPVLRRVVELLPGRLEPDALRPQKRARV